MTKIGTLSIGTLSSPKFPETFLAETQASLSPESPEQKWKRQEQLFEVLFDTLRQAVKNFDRQVNEPKEQKEIKELVDDLMYLAEWLTQTSAADWPGIYLNDPQACPLPIRQLLEVDAVCVIANCLRMAKKASAWREYTERPIVTDEGGEWRTVRVLSNKEYRNQLRDSFKVLTTLYGTQDMDQHIESSFSNLYASGGLAFERPTDIAEQRLAQHIIILDHYGKEMVGRLHRALGITDFTRFSSETLFSADKLLRGEANPEKRWGVLLVGRTGDHNRASYNAFSGYTGTGILPIEVGSDQEIADHLTILNQLGVRIKRVTVFGHGRSDRLILNQGQEIRNDAWSIAREFPNLVALLSSIEPDKDGSLPVTLCSCGTARGNRGNVASELSKVCENLRVYAPDRLLATYPVLSGAVHAKALSSLEGWAMFNEDNGVIRRLFEKLPGGLRVKKVLQSLFYKRWSNNYHGSKEPTKSMRVAGDGRVYPYKKVPFMID